MSVYITNKKKSVPRSRGAPERREGERGGSGVLSVYKKFVFLGPTV